MDQYLNTDAMISLTFGEALVVAVLAALLVIVGAALLKRSARKQEHDYHHALFRNQARQYQDHIHLLEKELREVRHSALMSSANILNKRTEGLETIYQQLVRFQRGLHGVASSVRFKGDIRVVAEAYEKTSPLLKAYIEVFDNRRLYFSEATGEWVAELNVGCLRAFEKVRVLLQTHDSLTRDVTDNLDEVINRALSHADEARQAVEKQFREIMSQGTRAENTNGPAL
ncbi:hypothetical protein QQM79_12950 [Marinobacteraceae bacterium S3BR75-40.1]